MKLTNFVDPAAYVDHREEFLKALQAHIEYSFVTFGVKDRNSKTGRMITSVILSSFYDLVAQDPALWVAALRGDPKELTNWMERSKA